MNIFRRFAYFGYYIRNLNWQQLGRFMRYVREETGVSGFRQWVQIIRDSFRFNISILEYYQFRFFELSDETKSDWAGTGTMYEFQRLANPLETRGVLRDKRKFYKAYKKFFKHELHTLEELKQAPERLNALLIKNERLVFKEATGNCGASVTIRPVSELVLSEVIDYMESNGFDLVETFVEQHADLTALSPSAVNTIRVFTQITKERGYEVLGCRLRISVDSPVDNLAAGNLAAPIDTDSGVVYGPGVYSDITQNSVDIHPITGVSIVNFHVPFWDDVLDLVKQASLLHPENRSIGWDVVVTDDGPGLIEGNHDWCKLVWQLPVQRGLKNLLVFRQ